MNIKRFRGYLGIFSAAGVLYSMNGCIPDQMQLQQFGADFLRSLTAALLL